MSLVKINDLFVEHLPGNGKKMVFIHGAGGGSWYWQPFMKFYNNLGFDCYAINLRGHAPNPCIVGIGGVSLFDYIEDVTTVLNEIGADKYIIFGHSMGGLIAQKYAADNPEKILALTLIGTAPPAKVKLEKTKMKKVSHRVKARIIGWGLQYVTVKKKPIVPVYGVTKRYIANCIPKKEQRDFFRKLVPESSTVGAELIMGVLDVDLSNLTAPKIVVSGELDLMSVSKMQKKVADLHKAKLISYPTHGHMLMMEPGWEKCADDINACLIENNISN